MDEANYLAAKWGVPVAVAFMAVAVRLLFTADRWTIIGIVRGLAVGALVGWMAGLWVWEMEKLDLFWLITIDPLTAGQKGCIIALFAMLAEDIFMGLIVLGQKFREDPLWFISVIINRGNKP